MSDFLTVKPGDPVEYPDWHAEFKDMEAAFHGVQTEYSELAAALGFERRSWFDDPFESHAEILARAKEAGEALTSVVAAAKREIANIGSVHLFLNGMVITFDRDGRQMPMFQGPSKEVLPLLKRCGWKGETNLSEVANEVAP